MPSCVPARPPWGHPLGVRRPLVYGAPLDGLRDQLRCLQVHKQQCVKLLAPPWAIGWLAEAAWQFAFVRDTAVGMLISAALLVTAAVAFHVAAVRAPAAAAPLPPAARWLPSVPTSINAAWLLVATTVGIIIAVLRNAAAVPAVELSIAGAAAVLAGGFTFVLIRRDAAYCFTLLWAFAGVRAGVNAEFPAVGGIATAAMVLFAGTGASILALKYATQCGGAGEEEAKEGGVSGSLSEGQALVADEQ